MCPDIGRANVVQSPDSRSAASTSYSEVSPDRNKRRTRRGSRSRFDLLGFRCTLSRRRKEHPGFTSREITLNAATAPTRAILSLTRPCAREEHEQVQTSCALWVRSRGEETARRRSFTFMPLALLYFGVRMKGMTSDAHVAYP